MEDEEYLKRHCKYDPITGEYYVPEANIIGHITSKDMEEVFLTIVWNNEIKRSTQLLILRKIFLKLKDIKTEEIIKNTKMEKWQFAKVKRMDAIEFLEIAKKNGLNVIMEE